MEYPTVRDLYPHLTDEELAEVEDRIEQYLSLVLRIYERIRNDPEEWLKYQKLRALTGNQRRRN